MPAGAWTDREFLDASKMTTRIKTPLDSLLGPPLAIMRQTVPSTIANGGFSGVLWDSEDKDTAGGHSTVTNTDRYTFQASGTYATGGDMAWAVSTATGWVGACIEVNGVAAQRFGLNSQTKLNDAIVRHTATGLVLITATAGDYIRLMGANGTGSSINTVPTDLGCVMRWYVWRVSE